MLPTPQCTVPFLLFLWFTCETTSRLEDTSPRCVRDCLGAFAAIRYLRKDTIEDDTYQALT